MSINQTEIRAFNFDGNEIRMVFIDDEAWWVAKDVCEAMGETNYRRAVQSLDEDEKGMSQVYTLGGSQNMLIVNESGLYSLLLAMQPTKARGVTEDYITEREMKLKSFKRWVTHDVLPSIHRHGAYVTPSTLEEIMNDPDAWIKLLTALKEERAAKQKLIETVQEIRPKAALQEGFVLTNNACSLNAMK